MRRCPFLLLLVTASVLTTSGVASYSLDSYTVVRHNSKPKTFSVPLTDGRYLTDSGSRDPSLRELVDAWGANFAPPSLFPRTADTGDFGGDKGYAAEDDGDSGQLRMSAGEEDDGTTLEQAFPVVPQKDRHETEKRQGPSLSIVNPLDVLRQRLLLDMARRRIKENQQQIQANAELLKNLGKRNDPSQRQRRDYRDLAQDSEEREESPRLSSFQLSSA